MFHVCGTPRAKYRDVHSTEFDRIHRVGHTSPGGPPSEHSVLLFDCYYSAVQSRFRLDTLEMSIKPAFDHSPNHSLNHSLEGEPDFQL
jgi:hypothetical protein